MRPRLRTRKPYGFTLTELLIVVAIVGILAAMAIPNFLRYQLRTRRAEGATNVAAIRTAQVAYFGVRDQFVSPSDPNPPNHPFDGKKHSWDSTDPLWGALGFEPEGDVYYQYATEAGSGAAASALLISAIADLDSDGSFSCWVFAKPTYAADGAISSALEAPEVCGDGTNVDSDGNLVPIEPEYEKVDLISGDSRY